MTVFYLTSNAEEEDLKVQYKGAASVRPKRCFLQHGHKGGHFGSFLWPWPIDSFLP
jgi:hypothetical protein